MASMGSESKSSSAPWWAVWGLIFVTVVSMPVLINVGSWWAGAVADSACDTTQALDCDTPPTTAPHVTAPVAAGTVNPATDTYVVTWSCPTYWPDVDTDTARLAAGCTPIATALASTLGLDKLTPTSPTATPAAHTDTPTTTAATADDSGLPFIVRLVIAVIVGLVAAGGLVIARQYKAQNSLQDARDARNMRAATPRQTSDGFIDVESWEQAS